MSHLKNKTAVITGASRGIGAATARHFAAEGANVVLAARTTSEIEAIAEEIRAAGGAASAIACDVSRYDDVEAAMAPPAVLDYVAAHEAAHLIEMNHGPRFWALVETLRPDWRDQRSWLRKQGGALHRYRFSAA